MSHKLTLVLTRDAECPGVDIDTLGGTRPGTFGEELHAITAIRHWITFERQEGEQVRILGEKDNLPEHLARRSVTVPVNDAIYRRFKQARAEARGD